MLEQKVLKTIEKYNLITSGDRVLVAVSGGIDSVVLLHVLMQMADELDITLGLAHLDHQMRDESHLDARFVKDLAEHYEIEAIIHEEDAFESKSRLRTSLEAASREMRYQFLKSAAQMFNTSVVVLGHHLDDRIETFFINLFRGSGLDGLASMPAVRVDHGIRFVRPLFELTRHEIEDYVEQHGLGFREDMSNQDTAFTRNRIRHQLMPLMLEFNPNLAELMAGTLGNLENARQFLTDVWQAEYERVVVAEEADKVCLNRAELLMLQEYPLSNVIRRAIFAIKGDLEGVESVHIVRAVQEIGKTQSGTEIPFLDGLKMIVESERVIILNASAQGSEMEPFEFELDIAGRFECEKIGWRFDLQVLDHVGEISDDPWEAHFDFDKIVGPIGIRNRRSGDRFCPMGLGGMKKIQDLLVDAKIPRRERDRIPLLVTEQEIMWAVGLRISQSYCVTPATERVLHVRAFDLRGVN